MQGKLPCHNCPYGEICEKCPELLAREREAKLPPEKGGFYSHEVVRIVGPDGKETFAYSHPE